MYKNINQIFLYPTARVRAREDFSLRSDAVPEKYLEKNYFFEFTKTPLKKKKVPRKEKSPDRP